MRTPKTSRRGGSSSRTTARARRWPGTRKCRVFRRHALWLIEHHPEHDVQAPALSPQFDPEGFSAAKKLWEAYLARPDVSPFLVFRAASFFAPHDKPYAEQLILRGMAMDPARSSVRDKLEATTDAQLLARVGQILTRPNLHTKDPALKQAPDQIRALGPTHCRSTTSRNINMRRRVPVNDGV